MVISLKVSEPIDNLLYQGLTVPSRQKDYHFKDTSKAGMLSVDTNEFSLQWPFAAKEKDL